MPAALLFVPLISPYPAPASALALALAAPLPSSSPVRALARGSLNPVNGHIYREPRNFI